MKNVVTMVKKYNHTKRREDIYLKVKELINRNTTADWNTALMNEITNLLLDCLFHIGCDQSKLNNKKRVMVVNQSMKEEEVHILIDNTTGENVPHSDVEHADTV